MTLEDESRLILSRDAQLRLLPPDNGERIHVRLERGELEADIAPGTGTFRLSTPAGDVRVLGTRFMLRTYEMTLPGCENVPYFYLDLYEGKVSIGNAQGTVVLQAPGRGLVVAGQGPMRDVAFDEESEREVPVGDLEKPKASRVSNSSLSRGWGVQYRGPERGKLSRTSRWGQLPQKVRDSLRHSQKEVLDDPHYESWFKRYTEALEREE